MVELIDWSRPELSLKNYYKFGIPFNIIYWQLSIVFP